MRIGKLLDYIPNEGRENTWGVYSANPVLFRFSVANECKVVSVISPNLQVLLLLNLLYCNSWPTL